MMTMHAPTLLSQVQSQLKRTFGELIVEPPIRRNIKLTEAPSEGIPIHVHAPSESKGGKDYRDLAVNLAQRWNLTLE